MNALTDAEVAKLLGVASQLDRWAPEATPEVCQLWRRVIAHRVPWITLRVALDAVQDHYGRQARTITPADVVAYAKRRAEDVLSRVVEPDYPPELTAWQERRWRSVWLAALTSGASEAEARDAADDRFQIARAPQLPANHPRAIAARGGAPWPPALGRGVP